MHAIVLQDAVTYLVMDAHALVTTAKKDVWVRFHMKSHPFNGI